MATKSDQQLRDLLREIDESDDVDVSAWEAGFIDSVVYKYNGPLSDKQRDSAESIIEKYEDQL